MRLYNTLHSTLEPISSLFLDSAERSGVRSQPWSCGSIDKTWHNIQVFTSLFSHSLLEGPCAEGQGGKWPLPTGNFFCPCAVGDVIIGAGGRPIPAASHSQFISLKAPDGI